MDNGRGNIIAPMSLEDLQGAFILILIGWILAIGAFGTEILRGKSSPGIVY